MHQHSELQLIITDTSVSIWHAVL